MQNERELCSKSDFSRLFLFQRCCCFFSFFRQPPFPALRAFGLPQLSWRSHLLVGFRSSEKRVREAVNCLQLSRVTSLSGASCVDKSPSCGYWALIGECTKNPGYMLTSCCVWCNHMKSTYPENEMHLLNYYKTARFCVVSYTAGSLLLFGVTQRQERCVASLECGIFTGYPRGPEPPGHKGNNVIDVVRLFACLFFFGRLCFRKNRNSRENNHFSWTKHY